MLSVLLIVKTYYFNYFTTNGSTFLSINLLFFSKAVTKKIEKLKGFLSEKKYLKEKRIII